MNTAQDMERFERAVALIGAVNAEDPRRCLVDGVEQPYELVYAERMSATLERYRPTASEWLRLAVRAQHLRRWAIPRDRYPKDRIGYLKWRHELKRRHAAEAGEIMAACRYPAGAIERVGSLIRKEHLKHDEEAQDLEDVACLVFLEHYFDEFAETQPDVKLVDIVQKTWLKMSAGGRDAALALPLSSNAQRIVTLALNDCLARCGGLCAALFHPAAGVHPAGSVLTAAERAAASRTT